MTPDDRPPSPPLPPRLEAVASRIPRGSRTADIGSDHGLLAARLLRLGRVPWCVATEVDAARADRLASAASAVRVGDGLLALRTSDAVETAAICGLGGRTVARIVRQAPRRPSIANLVVQPQSHHDAVRRALDDEGFGIVDEAVVVDRGRPYVIVVARRGAPALASHAAEARSRGLRGSDLAHVGPVLLRDGCRGAIAWWERQRARLEAIVASPGGADRRTPDLERARRILRALRYTAGVRRLPTDPGDPPS